MNQTVLAITYIVIFIPSIFLFYFTLQSLNYDKLLKAGKQMYFKVFYVLLCIILAFSLSFALTYTIDKVGQIIIK